MHNLLVDPLIRVRRPNGAIDKPTLPLPKAQALCQLHGGRPIGIG